MSLEQDMAAARRAVGALDPAYAPSPPAVR